MRYYAVGECVEFYTTEEDRKEYSINQDVFFGEIAELDHSAGILNLEILVSRDSSNEPDQYFKEFTILEIHRRNKKSYVLSDALQKAYNKQLEQKVSSEHDKSMDLTITEMDELSDVVPENLEDQLQMSDSFKDSDSTAISDDGNEEDISGKKNTDIEDEDGTRDSLEEPEAAIRVEATGEEAAGSQEDGTFESQKDENEGENLEKGGELIIQKEEEEVASGTLAEGATAVEQPKCDEQPAEADDATSSTEDDTNTSRKGKQSPAKKNTKVDSTEVKRKRKRLEENTGSAAEPRRSKRLPKPIFKNVDYNMDEFGNVVKVVNPRNWMTMDECLSQFGCAVPSKKFAREHGIKYWKKFECQVKMIQLYSSSEESEEETEEETEEVPAAQGLYDYDSSGDSNYEFPSSAAVSSDCYSSPFTSEAEDANKSRKERKLRKKMEAKKSHQSSKRRTSQDKRIDRKSRSQISKQKTDKTRSSKRQGGPGRPKKKNKSESVSDSGSDDDFVKNKRLNKSKGPSIRLVNTSRRVSLKEPRESATIGRNIDKSSKKSNRKKSDNTSIKPSSSERHSTKDEREKKSLSKSRPNRRKNSAEKESHEQKYDSDDGKEGSSRGRKMHRPSDSRPSNAKEKDRANKKRTERNQGKLKKKRRLYRADSDQDVPAQEFSDAESLEQEIPAKKMLEHRTTELYQLRNKITAAKRDKSEKTNKDERRRIKKTRGQPFQDESEEEQSEDEISEEDTESHKKKTLSNKRGDESGHRKSEKEDKKKSKKREERRKKKRYSKPSHSENSESEEDLIKKKSTDRGGISGLRKKGLEREKKKVDDKKGKGKTRQRDATPGSDEMTSEDENWEQEVPAKESTKQSDFNERVPARTSYRVQETPRPGKEINPGRRLQLNNSASSSPLVQNVLSRLKKPGTRAMFLKKFLENFGSYSKDEEVGSAVYIKEDQEGNDIVCVFDVQENCRRGPMTVQDESTCTLLWGSVQLITSDRYGETARKLMIQETVYCAAVGDFFLDAGDQGAVVKLTLPVAPYLTDSMLE